MALPATPAFKRPKDLAYASDERPPGLTLLVLAIQHIATALALIAYVLAAAKIGGLDVPSTQKLVTATLLSMAIATFLQSWGGKLGSGLLLVHIPSVILVTLLGTVMLKYGLGSMVIAGIIYAIVGWVVSYIMPRLRAILPPAVAGVLLVLAALSLVVPAIKNMEGLTASGDFSGLTATIGVITLAIIIGLSIWGAGQIKLFALLIGMIAGSILAAALGQFHGFSLLASAPLVALPSLPVPVFNVDPGALAAIAVLALMTQLGTFAYVVLVHKMNDADWRRANMTMVGGAMRANAIGNFLCAWLGAYPSAISSTNIALNHVSRSTSRWIGLLTGLLIALVAFLPQVSLALTLIPTPVIGAVEAYSAAYLMVSGVQLLASRAIDTRGIFTIGLSFVAGASVMLIPALARQVPESVHFLFQSGVVVGGVSAIVLNLIFRIGVSKSAQRAVSADPAQPGAAQQVVDFIEEQGTIWNARRDAITRAAQAGLEAAEAIAAAGGRSLTAVRGGFDEFNLDIELTHTGAPLVLEAQRITPDANPLDADDAAFEAMLERTMTSVSHVMLKRLADRLSSGTRNGQAFLRLHFDH